jgi:peptidyl-prolyl cis-trans isomerase C
MRKRRGTWFLTITAALIIAWIALPALTGEKKAQPDAIAVVNGSVITQEDFDRETSRIRQLFASMGKPLQDSQLHEMKEKILEGLISSELLYQESQSSGIKVEETAINEQLDKLKGRFSSESEFESTLAEVNLSEAVLRSQIRRGLTIQLFITRQFIQKAAVTDKEIKAYYKNHSNAFKQKEQVKASHILIKVDPSAKEPQKAAAREKIEGILQQLHKGEDFANLAKKFSQCSSSANGGDLGYFKRGDMVKPFEEVSFDLQPGEVSDIVETKFGYHLIKVMDKKPEATIAYEDVKKRLEQYLKRQKAQKEVSQYVEKIKGKAKIERYLVDASQ